MMTEATRHSDGPVHRTARAIMLAALLLTSGCASIGREVPSDRLAVKTSFVSYKVTSKRKSLLVAGELRVPSPERTAPRPAVVIVHGSMGVDSRGQLYADALNAIGFVTLEIDLWAARGVRGPGERPKTVAETLPDAFGALAFLSRRPEVDARRIGIMGFSWGGVVSMLSATKKYRDAFALGGQTFAAHAPLYPVCWVYNVAPGYDFAELTGAPALIQAGTADEYDAPATCTHLQESLKEPARSSVSVKMYEGATHGWDRREPDGMITDPYSHLGKGGQVPLTSDPAATEASLAAVISFFSRTLGPK